MSSAHKNLSVYNTDGIIDISNKKFAVVVAEWNEEITGALYQGVFDTLIKHGAQKENILKIDVPGSYELSYGSQVYAAKEEIDAVIANGAGVYLELHGAMATEHFDDGEGELLSRVRATVGQDVPIVVSLDYHANISRQMVQMADGFAIYRTYPHSDQIETGRRAARLLQQVMEH